MPHGLGTIMNVDEILVIAGGIAAIVWVNWYFLFAGSESEPPTHEKH